MTEKDIKTQRDLCDHNVRVWTSKLKEAQEQLEYWTRQQDAIRTLSTRLMLDGWAAEASKNCKEITK